MNEIACALSDTVHTSTGITPFMAVYGFNMIFNGNDYVLQVDKNGEELPSSDKRYAIRQYVRDQLLKAFERTTKIHNRWVGSRIIDFAKDTYLKNQKQSNAAERYSRKLAPKYIPVIIDRKVGKDTFLVSNFNGKPLGKYHSSLLLQK